MPPSLRTLTLASLLALTAACDLDARVRLPFAGHPTVHVTYHDRSAPRPPPAGP